MMFEPVHVSDAFGAGADNGTTVAANDTMPAGITRDKAVLGALFVPAGAVQNDTLLVAGVVSEEMLSSDVNDLADPSLATNGSDVLGPGMDNFRYGTRKTPLAFACRQHYFACL